MNISTTHTGKRPNLLQRLTAALDWAEATSTPEWRALQRAFENGNKPVLAVALEVFVSHYSHRFSSAQRFALRCLAQRIRVR